MVSGLIGGKTIRTGIQDIIFVVYEIIDNHMYKPSEQFKKLKQLGFTTAINSLTSDLSINNLSQLVPEFKQKSNYEIDGIIIQSNVSYDRNINGNPSYLFAFKVRDDDNIASTEVLDIEWSVSKHGTIVPVAITKPVTLSGATLSRFSCHNASNLINQNISKGAIVQVTRSKDVIPHILDTISFRHKPSLPDEYNYFWDKNKVHIMVDLDNCDELTEKTMCVKMFASFFDKLNIKHVSEATVSKIYDNGYTSLLDIIKITKKQLMSDCGFKDKGSDRIIKNIHKGLQNTTIPLLLGSSGIFGNGIGRKRMDILFTDIPELLTFNKKSLKKRILKVEGFSEIMAQKIIDNIDDAKLFIDDISPYVSFKKETRVSDSLVGKKFVMSGFRDKKLEQDIIDRGGSVSTSVSKKTSGLIVSNKENKTGKILSAEKLGVGIYNKDEFIKEHIS